uniref:Uncharacterized protein n=1 Tax=Pseudomonas phage PACT201 TaxID=3230130 RepID=A0AAU8GVY4_9VIRU
MPLLFRKTTLEAVLRPQLRAGKRAGYAPLRTCSRQVARSWTTHRPCRATSMRRARYGLMLVDRRSTALRERDRRQPARHHSRRHRAYAPPSGVSGNRRAANRSHPLGDPSGATAARVSRPAVSCSTPSHWDADRA